MSYPIADDVWPWDKRYWAHVDRAVVAAHAGHRLRAWYWEQRARLIRGRRRNWMRWLCRVAVHRWDTGNPNQFSQRTRRCVRCGKTQLRTGMSGWRNVR